MTILALIIGYLVLSTLVGPLVAACIHFGVCEEPPALSHGCRKQTEVSVI